MKIIIIIIIINIGEEDARMVVKVLFYNYLKIL
jgi:hypothetical protein